MGALILLALPIAFICIVVSATKNKGDSSNTQQNNYNSRRQEDEDIYAVTHFIDNDHRGFF